MHLREVRIGAAALVALLAACGEHSISGTVSGAVSEGVVITLGGRSSATTVTGADGTYAFRDLEHGAYTITAEFPGHAFAPASRSATIDGGSVEAQDFRATALAGTLDARFGDGGGVVVGGTGASGVALQPDGKIVVAGRADVDGAVAVGLARLDSAGALDPTFGTGGRVTTSKGRGSVLEPRAVALQVDGRIVVAGAALDPAALVLTAFVARYEADGRPDTSFGDGGIVTTLPPGATGGADASAIAIQPDGRIVVAGHASLGGGNADHLLARYGPDGRLDATFGDGGVVLGALGSYSYAYASALQPDGKIVVAGYSQADVTALTGRTFVARYFPDGSIDGAFGDGGFATPPAFSTPADQTAAESDAAFALALQPDGKIVTAGFAGAPTNPRSQERWGALARFLPDGKVDLSFGGPSPYAMSAPGTVNLTGSGPTEAGAVAVQRDGKILAAGPSRRTYPTTLDLAVARLGADGMLDAGFGELGRVTTSLTGSDTARAVVLQPDGKIVVAGDTNGANFCVVRYWP